jgi:hypothetical protein
VLERQEEEGRWRSLGEAGFPAGLPRTMLLDVTGKLGGPRCRLRLRTNRRDHRPIAVRRHAQLPACGRRTLSQ